MHDCIITTSLNLTSFFPILQHKHEWSQRDHRGVCVWRPVHQQHTHHLCDQRSETVTGNQSQSQHRRPRHRQDGKRGQSDPPETEQCCVGFIFTSTSYCVFHQGFVFLLRTTLISSTLMCGRPDSHGVVCLHPRRAHSPSLLKARPSCWTPALLCWKCSSFKVFLFINIFIFCIVIWIPIFCHQYKVFNFPFLCAQEGHWCLMKPTLSCRQKTSWSQTADGSRSARRGRRSSTKPSSHFTETCAHLNFPFTEPRHWLSERECLTSMVWTHRNSFFCTRFICKI